MLITFVDENGVKGHHIVHMRDPPNKLEKHKKNCFIQKYQSQLDPKRQLVKFLLFNMAQSMTKS